MTATQLLEWEAYAEVEQFGEARADSRAAFIVRGLFNINRDTKQHSQPFELKPFIADLLQELEELPAKKRTQTWQQQKAILKMMLLREPTPKAKP